MQWVAIASPQELIDHGWLATRSLPFGFGLVGLSQPHARSSAVFVDELDALTRQDVFDQRERSRVPRIATDLDVRNRIPMETSRRC